MDWYIRLRCFIWKQPLQPLWYLVLSPLLIVGRLLTILVALFFGVEMKWQIAREGRRKK